MSDLLRPPEPPVRQLVLASVLALLVVLVAAVGLGAGTSGSDARGVPDQVTVAGRPLGDGSVVRVDLEQPIEVRIPEGLADAATAQIELRVLGQSVGRSDLAPIVTGADGVAWPPRRCRRPASSPAANWPPSWCWPTSRATPSRRDFAVRSDHLGPTLAAVLALALALVVAAYVASTTKPLRLGRRKTSAFEGMGVLGALAGIDVVLWGWVLGLSRPTWIAVALGALLGAGAAVVAAQAILVLGRRRRLRLALQDL
ncbi:MAG: hypothetical protein R2746_07930 [Acidimicrobiales bacterium]